jgi:hypothetical protein
LNWISISDYIVTYDASATTHKKVLINNLPSGGGETNTASNVGVGGVGTFKQKTGVDLEFKNINAGSSKVTITDDTGNNEIEIDIAEGNVDHDALLNYVANDHIDHSGVSVTGGIGLSGGGAITSSSTINLDINSLTADATPDSAADYVVTYDASATTHKKVLMSNLPAGTPTITNSSVTATATTSTTSTTYTPLGSMAITPASGTYFVSFSSSGHGSATNADHQYALHNAGTIIAHSERMDGEDSGSQNNGTTRAMHSQGVITVNGSQEITVQYKTSTGSYTVYERSLIILKLS